MRRNLPEGENLTKDIFLKKGGKISVNRVEESRSLILTEIIFSLLMIGFYSIGFREGSSLASCSELPLDLLPIEKGGPSTVRLSKPLILADVDILVLD